MKKIVTSRCKADSSPCTKMWGHYRTVNPRVFAFTDFCLITYRIYLLLFIIFVLRPKPCLKKYIVYCFGAICWHVGAKRVELQGGASCHFVAKITRFLIFERHDVHFRCRFIPMESFQLCKILQAYTPHNLSYFLLASLLLVLSRCDL